MGLVQFRAARAHWQVRSGHWGFSADFPQAFFRCLLILDELLATGLQGLPNDQRWEFYYLVLRSPCPQSVPLNLSADEYKSTAHRASVGDSDSSEASGSPILTEAGYDGQLQERSPRMPVAKRPRINDEGIDSLIAGAQIRGGAHSAERSGQCAVPSPSVQPVIPATDGQWLPPPPPPSEHGMQFTVDHLTFSVVRWPVVPSSDGRAQRTRFFVQCPLAGHVTGHSDCKKYRNASDSHCRAFGPWEPVAYLVLWAGQCNRHLVKAEHLRAIPSATDIRDFMRSKNWIAPS